MKDLQTSTGSKTRQQIALEFGFSYPTFWRKLKEYGIDLPKGLICPRWQEIIYDKLGYPPGVSGKIHEQEYVREIL